jgi:hypothetical protein
LIAKIDANRKFVASFDTKDLIGNLVAVSFKSNPSNFTIFYLIEIKNRQFLMINIKKLSKIDQKWLIAHSFEGSPTDIVNLNIFLARNRVRQSTELHFFKTIAKIFPIKVPDSVK